MLRKGVRRCCVVAGIPKEEKQGQVSGVLNLLIGVRV